MTPAQFDALRVGDTVFVHAPSLESCNNGDAAPTPPREVKVTRIHRDRQGLVAASGFCRETGVVDDDSNAATHTGPGETFLALAEAEASHGLACDGYVRHLLREAGVYARAAETKSLIARAFDSAGETA